ncbi:MAG TPA: DUF4198 domain-containing protein [Turneriella sp.]|nr:DUF4198 domain-containing protein [Turneriella sp.]HNE18310.1 DUF4198 domain-containing protein [Turneriella sp.]HNL09374.1 DUF4198 domain-containing protein [Turneriella sp.]HNL53542.1 DUF4198 domain-containing protein [Turneriella sp.]HNM99480.1 DUF4198 domain-containing protein [Turneriella sp.]
MKRLLTLLAAALLLPGILSAHYIWIEREGGTARVYYGEIQDGERETSPGKLDKITGLRVYTADKKGQNKEVKNTKTAEFFVAEAGKAEFVLADSLDVPVADMKKYNWGMVKPMYYARHGAQSANAEVRPAQTLDIVPVAGGQNVFQVFFNGKPLKGEKLMVYAPNTWAKEYKTDAEGKVKLETPWAGQYVLEVIHTDKTPGKFEGKDYESVRHRATYTFKKELPHPPAPSP